MKRLLIVLVAALFISGGFFAIAEQPTVATAEEETIQKEEKEDPPTYCPETYMRDKCFYCHTAPTFAVKEADPHVIYEYPRVGSSNDFRFGFDKDGKPSVGYFIMEEVDANTLQEIMDYCRRHGVKHLVVELFTPGGGLGDAYKAVGLMRHWRADGNVVETRVYGYAASAGFLIFASGNKGHRLTSRQAELMWHELQTLDWFQISTPSDKEDEARVLRHLQDTANSWLAEVSNLSKEEVDELVRYKELWITGVEAVEYGFADGFIGQ